LVSEDFEKVSALAVKVFVEIVERIRLLKNH